VEFAPKEAADVRIVSVVSSFILVQWLGPGKFALALSKGQENDAQTNFDDPDRLTFDILRRQAINGAMPNLTIEHRQLLY
jgi:hypothetical protein